MGRAKLILAAVTKSLDEHYRVLDDEKTRLRSLRIVVRMGTDGKLPAQVNISPEFEKKI